MIYLVFVLAVLLRLINLNQSLWLDEAIETLAVKSNSSFDLVFKYSVGDFHPPLYHLILKFWTGIVGYSEAALRFPSIVFGVLTTGFVYKVGLSLRGHRTGVIAAFFWVINPLSVYYSQEARMYSLAALLTAAVFYFLIQKKAWLFFLSLALLLYTDYLPYLLLPVLFFLARREKRVFYAFWYAVDLTLVWLPMAYRQLKTATAVAASAPLWGQAVGGFSVKALPLTLVKFIIGRISLADKLVYALAIAPVIVSYLLVLVRAQKAILWWWLLVPLMLGFILSLFIPIYSYFRFLFVLPAFVLLLAVGARRSKAGIVLITFVSFTSLIIFNLNSGFHRENWREAVRYMEARGNLAVMPSLAQAAPLEYYHQSLAYTDSRHLNDEMLLMVHPLSSVFLVRYVQEIFDPNDLAKFKLEKAGYHKVEEKSFQGILVWQYRKY